MGQFAIDVQVAWLIDAAAADDILLVLRSEYLISPRVVPELQVEVRGKVLLENQSFKSPRCSKPKQSLCWTWLLVRIESKELSVNYFRMYRDATSSGRFSGNHSPPFSTHTSSSNLVATLSHDQFWYLYFRYIIQVPEILTAVSKTSIGVINFGFGSSVSTNDLDIIIPSWVLCNPPALQLVRRRLRKYYYTIFLNYLGNKQLKSELRKWISNPLAPASEFAYA